MPSLIQIADLQSVSQRKKKLTNDVLQKCLATVTAGAGYVRADGSTHTCGDITKSGLQCCLYRPKTKRCVILGPDLEITPSMTCIHQITGSELKVEPIVASTPAEVGLVDTKVGATCERCDRFDDDEKPACYWLTDSLRTLIQKEGYDASRVKYYVETGGCCSYWVNEKTQRLIPS